MALYLKNYKKDYSLYREIVKADFCISFRIWICLGTHFTAVDISFQTNGVLKVKDSHLENKS